jgi:hypothetical protein
MNSSIPTYYLLSPGALTVRTLDLAALRALKRMREQP